MGSEAKHSQGSAGTVLDMAPTPLRRRRNAAQCTGGCAEADMPRGEASTEPARAEEPLCRRGGIYGVSKRKALQQKGLCCNKCPNHGPWCTMHEQSACRKVVTSRVPDTEAMKHDQRS